MCVWEKRHSKSLRSSRDCRYNIVHAWANISGVHLHVSSRAKAHPWKRISNKKNVWILSWWFRRNYVNFFMFIGLLLDQHLLYSMRRGELILEWCNSKDSNEDSVQLHAALRNMRPNQLNQVPNIHFLKQRIMTYSANVEISGATEISNVQKWSMRSCSKIIGLIINKT